MVGDNGVDDLRVLVCAARSAPYTGLAIMNDAPFVSAAAFLRGPLVMTRHAYLQVILTCAPAILIHYAAPSNVAATNLWLYSMERDMGWF